jgi:tRNA dimethylallyltransferase
MAKSLQAEIVNVDSVQVYENFDIGSSKPSASQRALVPHHLFDICDPRQKFDVARFVSLATQKYLDITARGVLPIFTGGSTMYISLLISGLLKLPPANESLRSEFSVLDNEQLYSRLIEIDPAVAGKIHPNDRKRIIRALEILWQKSSGLGAEEDLKEFQLIREGIGPALILVPTLEREVLYERINQRVVRMMKLGWLDETHRLLDKYGSDCPPMQSLGYSQISAAIRRGELNQSVLEEDIARQTRRFAKRQLTFWRNEPAKKGWLTKPAKSENNLMIDLNDLSLQTVRRSRSQPAYESGFSELLERARCWLDSSPQSSEVWFLNAEKVN